jgi:hypothetical protein
MCQQTALTTVHGTQRTGQIEGIDQEMHCEQHGKDYPNDDDGSYNPFSLSRHVYHPF